MIGFKMIYKLSHSEHIVLSVERIGTFNEKAFLQLVVSKNQQTRRKKRMNFIAHVANISA